MEIKLMKTKAGKGYKIVVDGRWFYSSLKQVERMIADTATAAAFNTIEEPLAPLSEKK